MKKFETIELAMAHIAAQDEIIAKGEKDLNDALEEVAALSAKLDLQEKHNGDNIVTIDKKNYKLLGNRFFVGGEEVDASGLMKDKEELARMVKIKSGSLIQVKSN